MVRLMNTKYDRSLNVNTTINIILAVMSIPFAILIYYSEINAGWAFILGIAYRAIGIKESM